MRRLGTPGGALRRSTGVKAVLETQSPSAPLHPSTAPRPAWSLVLLSAAAHRSPVNLK
jgi:hypothetical protein